MNCNPTIPVQSVRGTTVYLGVFTTFNARSVTFDFSAWAASLGDGTFSVSLLRPGDTTPYAVAGLSIDDTQATWTFDATDTAQPGYGRAFLSYVTSDAMDMTVDFDVYIAQNSAPSGDTPPDPLESWYQQMLEAAAQAQTAAQSAEQSASAAADSESTVEGYKNAAETAAQNAAASQALADQYAAAAANAQSAAEAARDRAETAQTDAEAAKASAIAAAQATAADKLAADASAAAAAASEQAALASQAAAAASAAAVAESEQSAADAAAAAEAAKAAALAAQAAAQAASSAAASSAQAAATSATNAANSAAQIEQSAQKIDDLGEDVTALKTAVTSLENSDAWEELLAVTLEEDTSNISYIEETGNFNKRYKQLAIFVQLVGTVTIYPEFGFCGQSGSIVEGWLQHFYGCQNANYGAIKSSDSKHHAFLIDVLSTAPLTPVITRKINGAFTTSTYPSSVFGAAVPCIANETVAGLTYGFAINASTAQSAFPAGSKIKMYGVKRAK